MAVAVVVGLAVKAGAVANGRRRRSDLLFLSRRSFRPPTTRHAMPQTGNDREKVGMGRV
jgi:hypothetical protein